MSHSLTPVTGATRPWWRRRWIVALVIIAWTLLGFYGAQFIVAGAVAFLSSVGVPFGALSTAVFNTAGAVVVYVVALLIVIGVPWWLMGRATSLTLLGIDRLPTWANIGLAPLGFIVYFICSGLLIAAISQLVPGFNASQAQDVGFSQLNGQAEYILAFCTLVVLAPLAEELLFRGYLLGWLRRYIPTWAAVLTVSALFGAAHGQWNVALDTFVLSLVLCLLRVKSQSLWPSILLHMIKNGIAYYFLFINPVVLQTLQ